MVSRFPRFASEFREPGLYRTATMSGDPFSPPGKRVTEPAGAAPPAREAPHAQNASNGVIVIPAVPTHSFEVARRCDGVPADL
jgi:hypothetical protein